MSGGHDTMPFRFGPNSWCTEERAEEMGYTRYVPKPGEDEARAAARERTKAGIRAAYRALRSAPVQRAAPQKPAARTAPTFDRLPPMPAGPGVPLVRMSGSELRDYSATLDEWLAGCASKSLSIGDALRFDLVKQRADEAWTLALMSR